MMLKDLKTKKIKMVIKMILHMFKANLILLANRPTPY